MVEPAVADVVGPSVAADEPHAFLDEIVGEGFEPPRLGGGECGEPAAQRLDALALGRDAGLVRLVRIEQREGEAGFDPSREYFTGTRSQRSDVHVCLQSLS